MSSMRAKLVSQATGVGIVEFASAMGAADGARQHSRRLAYS
jgi:hypothetical protein